MDRARNASARGQGEAELPQDVANLAVNGKPRKGIQGAKINLTIQHVEDEQLRLAAPGEQWRSGFRHARLPPAHEHVSVGCCGPQRIEQAHRAPELPSPQVLPAAGAEDTLFAGLAA